MGVGESRLRLKLAYPDTCMNNCNIVSVLNLSHFILTNIAFNVVGVYIGWTDILPSCKLAYCGKKSKWVGASEWEYVMTIHAHLLYTVTDTCPS